MHWYLVLSMPSTLFIYMPFYIQFTCLLHPIYILFTCHLHVCYILFTCNLHPSYIQLSCLGFDASLDLFAEELLDLWINPIVLQGVEYKVALIAGIWDGKGFKLHFK